MSIDKISGEALFPTSQAVDLDVDKIDKQIDRMMPELGFAPEDNDRLVASYSGGWQMRMCLGKILLQVGFLQGGGLARARVQTLCSRFASSWHGHCVEADLCQGKLPWHAGSKQIRIRPSSPYITCLPAQYATGHSLGL